MNGSLCFFAAAVRSYAHLQYYIEWPKKVGIHDYLGKYISFTEKCFRKKLQFKKIYLLILSV